MEGNLSLADAKAAVADQDDLEPEILELTESDSETGDDGAWKTSKTRRKTLVIASFGMSVLWVAVCVGGLFWANSAGLLGANTPANVATFIGAFGVPLCLIWIVTLVLQRSDPLLERRLAIARTLQASIAPVDAAEAKLDRMLQRLQRDIVTVDQTVLLASERIGALEDRFKEQVSNLFSATTDAEAKSASIREQLRRERDSVEGLIETLSQHLVSMKKTIEDAADKTIQAETDSRQAFETATTTFEAQYGALLSASQSATKGISTAMNGLAERTTALDAAALAATQKLDKGVTALKSHEDDYRTFISDFSNDFKSFDSAIDTRLVALEAAQNRLDRSGASTATQLETLGKTTSDTVDAALEKTASAALALDDQKESVRSFMEETLAALEQAQSGYMANLATFKEQTAALSQQATTHVKAAQEAHDIAANDLFKTTREHVVQWTDEVSKFNLLLSDSTERAGTVAADRIEQAKRSLIQSVDGINASTAQQVLSLQETISAQTTALNAALAGQDASFAKQSAMLEERIAQLEGASSAVDGAFASAGAHVEDMRTQMSDTLAGLDETAKSNAKQMLAQLQQVSDEAKSLHALPENLTSRWTAALTDAQNASDEIAQKASTQFGQIQSLAQETRAASTAAAGTVQTSVDQLAELVKQLDTDVTTSTNRAALAQKMMQAITQASSDANGQLDALTGGFSKLKALVGDISTKDLVELDKAKADMEDALTAFDAMAEALRGKAADNTKAILGDYQNTLAEASKLAQQTDTAARQASQVVAKSANQAIDLARLKWGQFSDEKQADTLKHFETMATSLTASLNTTATQVQKRLEEIRTTSATTFATVSKEASEAAQRNKETLDKVRQLTNQVEKHTTADLIRASSLIVDALNSLSIDINKSLNTGLSDDDWAKYLAGDKSIFTRQTVQAMTKNEREALRKRLQRDDDLKETVFRYLKDFELLMSRAMRGNEPTSLSVAIISSDIGKLYVALSQSVRRLN